MVVLVDGTADRTERIVAVGQRIRERELLKSARLRRLDDADVGDVVRRDRIELELKVLLVSDVVFFQDLIGHRAALCRRLLLTRQKGAVFFDQRSAHVVATASDQSYHLPLLSS